MRKVGITIITILAALLLIEGCSSSSAPVPMLQPEVEPGNAASITTPVPESEPGKMNPQVVVSDIIELATSDWEAFLAEYPEVKGSSDVEWERYSTTEYGFYISRAFYLEENECIEVTIKSDIPVAAWDVVTGGTAEDINAEFGDGLNLSIVCEHDPTGQWLSSYNRRRISGDMWETIVVFCSSIDGLNGGAGFYRVELENDSGDSVWCDYAVSLVDGNNQ
jgi:hypothetical protein